jgi:hypothetical protein
VISSFGKDRLRTTYLHARKTGLKVLDPAGGARWEKLERSPRVWIILACVDHIDDFFVTVHLDVMPFTKQSWQNESARMYSISLWFLALKHWDQEARVGRTFTVSLRLNEDEWSDYKVSFLFFLLVQHWSTPVIRKISEPPQSAFLIGPRCLMLLHVRPRYANCGARVVGL